jgi:DNA ligase D-like protein (predicted ligase)
MTDLLDRLSEEDRAAVRRARSPQWATPMLATLTDERFSDPDWIFERKLDGERCIGFRKGRQVRFLTRNRKDASSTYPEIVEALGGQGATDFVVDGEVVAFEGKQTSFARLQRRMQLRDPEAARRAGISVFYYVFDLLHWAGHDLTQVRLRARKALLRQALDFTDPLRFMAHRSKEGEPYYEEACRKGWEGLIAKRASAPYARKRSRDWLKFKCVRDQELVIGGFTDPQGSRPGFGALLVGYYEGDDLVYAGKVGTGYTEETLKDLRREMQGLERRKPPFGRRVRDLPRREVHWLEPELVALIAFTEWTTDGRLRHPRYQGLRRDKKARDVVREQA